MNSAGKGNIFTQHSEKHSFHGHIGDDLAIIIFQIRNSPLEDDDVSLKFERYSGINQGRCVRRAGVPWSHLSQFRAEGVVQNSGATFPPEIHLKRSKVLIAFLLGVVDGEYQLRPGTNCSQVFSPGDMRRSFFVFCSSVSSCLALQFLRVLLFSFFFVSFFSFVSLLFCFSGSFLQFFITCFFLSCSFSFVLFFRVWPSILVLLLLASCFSLLSPVLLQSFRFFVFSLFLSCLLQFLP
ncbi:hypothetical protein AVEN_125015-1 [Araneus ventricosus]|uniref:Uncharacterized protein n=1 Tax=Araneus ventricosus TaxID=182803 RepID=A0A4Y2GY79_ARAVE|nr:hypothetical protein AVEN_125015-1 [Araneus ventricosus]